MRQWQWQWKVQLSAASGGRRELDQRSNGMDGVRGAAIADLLSQSLECALLWEMSVSGMIVGRLRMRRLTFPFLFLCSAAIPTH